MAETVAQPAGTLATPGIPQKSSNLLTGTWGFIRRYPIIPIVFLALLIATAALGPLLTPYDPIIGELSDRHLKPFTRSEATGNYYLFGTDHVGRDMFTRLLYGSRVSLRVVSAALVSGALIGITLGVVSGYFGGWVDEAITRFVDIWYALPFLLVALIIAIIFGRDLNVLTAVLILTAWTGYVRVLRSQVLVLRGLDYVNAARVVGAGHARIILKHIIPGVLNTAIVIATLSTAGLFLAESVLSFVGAGVQPPTPAWGVMVDEGRDYINFAWWEVVVPGTAIFMVVISLNFLGDWLRDRFDPRLRQLS